MSVALIYRGNCEWEPSGNPEPGTALGGVPTTREPWMGRQDKTAQFRALYPVGRRYLGGYIIDNTPRDNTPCPGMASVDLIIASPPDFAKPTVSNEVVILTASVVATFGGGLDGVIGGARCTDATKDVTYYTPQTRYRYFSSTLPEGGRYNKVATTQLIPSVIRSAITANFQRLDEDGNPTDETFSKTYRGAAPAPLAVALALFAQSELINHSSNEIPGTPWFECEDTAAIVIIGG